jgi:mono/diheme cytochrome c family protein
LRVRVLTAFAAAFVVCAAWIVPAGAQDAAAIKRGEYIFNAAGCLGCHTDTKNNGKPLAGGRALPTPFGTFYSPNITPDRQTGIGAWSDSDFIRALREGVRPDGAYFFPVFPYTSFTGMSDGDIKDLRAYLMSVPAVAQANKPHDVGFPFSWRFLQSGWRLMNFTPGPFKSDPAKPAEVNRGAYIVQALAHCGECHTPRNFMGGLKTSLAYAGTPDGPEGERVPNITPHPTTGLGKWSPGDLTDLLKSGMTPDGDFVGSSMAEVVRNTTGKLSDDDLKAIMAYLRSLPPIDNAVRAKAK